MRRRPWKGAGAWVVAALGLVYATTAVTVTAQSAPAAQPGADAQLSKVLAQMDASAAKFRSAQADFSWDQLTAVVQEHDVQKGTIAFRRAGKGGAAGGTEMMVHVGTENDQPLPKDVLFRNGQLMLYQPEIKQETILQAGANRAQFESYATLGFGGTGKDLQAQWNVSYEGADTIDGVAVAKLGLTPKHTAPNQMFTHVEMWIDPATATSRKQIFVAAGGDTRTALYTNIRLNNADKDAFTLDVPSGTQVIRK